MNKLRFCFSPILFLAAALVAGPLLAQSDAQALEDHMRGVRSQVAQKRDSALKALLTMDAEQAKAFWPLQQAYDKELKALGKKDRTLIREFADAYKNLTTRSAKDIADRFFELERERLELQQKYFQQISDDVSPVVAVQFIQLQRRFESQLENERMKYAPIAE